MVMVDGHTHLFAPVQLVERSQLAARDQTFAELYADPAAKLAQADDLIAALDAAGIASAVVAGFAFAAGPDLECQNAYLLEAARLHPSRLWPLATTNPGIPGWQTRLRRWLEAGARGIGELRPGNQGWDPLGPAAHALCEVARAFDVPLLWHVSEPVGHHYPGKRGGIAPVDLIQLSAAHPGVKQVAAHLGGGLSFYLQMPEVRAAIDSIYFDTAAVPLLYDMESVARVVAIAGADRVIFGSDFPLLSPARQLKRLQAFLGADVAAAVCGGNAAILFGNRRLA